MSCFLAKFCVFFSSTCAFSNFPTVVQVDGKPFLRSTTGLCRLYIYPWKKREHGTHALAEVRSLLIFARQVDWFGIWLRVSLRRRAWQPRSQRPPIDGRTKHCILTAASSCHRQDVNPNGTFEVESCRSPVLL